MLGGPAFAIAKVWPPILWGYPQGYGSLWKTPENVRMITRHNSDK